MTVQTHCNSCGHRLDSDELKSDGYGPSGILLCARCRKLTTVQQRSGWQPVMQWEDGRDGLRLASLAPVPWRDSNVALLHLTSGGRGIRVSHTITGKQQILQSATPFDMVLAAWPGERRQDVFIVDDRVAALMALAAPKRR